MAWRHLHISETASELYRATIECILRRNRSIICTSGLLPNPGGKLFSSFHTKHLCSCFGVLLGYSVRSFC